MKPIQILSRKTKVKKLIELPKPVYKKVIKRKPQNGTNGIPPSKNYFDGKTQEAIVKFQTETNRQTRKELYEKVIEPAFSSLVENLINVYGYKILSETKQDLKIECVEFLYTIIDKFDVSKGSKAFSYFNVVAKNWLTIRSKQNAKNLQFFVSLDDKDSFSIRELELIENYKVVPACDEGIGHEEAQSNIKKLLDSLKTKVKTDNEKLCFDSIVLLFDTIHQIDFDNKRAIMAYMREITRLSPKQLSVILSVFKKYYKEYKQELEEK